MFGIFGALRASGSVQSRELYSNKIVRLEFIGGVPQSWILVVLMTDLPSDGSMCDNWCPKIISLLRGVARNHGPRRME